jgi:flagella basal body P-ring formation protein FlgA
MMRTAVALLLLALSAGPAAAQSYAQPRLKAQVTVAGDIVRVGDMIENAGLAADKPIFRAPDLGQTGAVPARAVLDAVRPYGLIAVDARGIVEVAVTHQSRVIAASDIETRIADALTARHTSGKPENLKIAFDREVRPIELAVTASELTLTRLSYDTFSRRFDVSFALPGNARTQWRFTGSAVETIEAAVPTRALARGEVFKAGDIVVERRAKSEFTSEPAVLAADVVGKAARRVVRAGQPLRNADLMKPEIVQKNDTVMLYYEVPGIVLTMRGKALESGAEGDLVSVLNVHSKRTIQGIVTGPGRVTVSAPHAALSSPSSAATAPNTARLAAASPSE